MRATTTRLTTGTAALAAIGAGALIGAGAAQAAPSAADTTFVMSNAQTNLAEMTIGQLALQKATSSEAKDLATMTIADHQAAMAKLTTVAQTLGITLPSAPNAEQQAQAATLQSTPVGAFDAAYAQIQVAGHQESIAGTNTEISTGSDATVKAYAQYYLPVAQKHLTMAETAVTDLGGTPGSASAGTGGQAATTSSTTEAVEIGLIAVGGVLVVGAGVVLARRRRVTA